ncbi:DUF2779 domain-containing protein [uncultured Microbulbifer sp.]|uniref:DUF2779 domain-containing protein n=1 Tax=uncultured Microbulbifer sp. TaxID=348147 RepID=UPI002614E9B2|nr:DUF2779 domain-containing protein [uncultured Microbulbifer sp.]
MPPSANSQQRPPLLTKSRFKRALECPTKLYYAEQPDYANQSLDDDFLAELAKGGHQVGALAKCYFPGGEDLTGLSPDEALIRTIELLQRDTVTIFEAAIRHEQLMIQVDILVKDGDHYELIEVKAKSWRQDDGNFMKRKGDGVVKKDEPYLCDIAFQQVVLERALKTGFIDCYLMLPNKQARAATDGLNSKFRVTADHQVIVSDNLGESDLAHGLLAKVDVNQSVEYIRKKMEFHGYFFDDYIAIAADALQKGERLRGQISSTCKTCEFHCTSEEGDHGQQSGFRECWKQELGWQDQDFEDPLVFEIAGFTKVDELVNANKVKLTDVEESDINPKGDGKPGLSRSERQWLQVMKVQQGDSTPEIDIDGLRKEIESWTYPMHFIDFETITAALPFTRGRRPYEGVAFQFSHHVLNADGSVEHADQFLDTTPGHFPSFDFIRALKGALEGDSGTIFRYADHENTFLNLIHRQLQDSDLPQAEVQELCGFIESISRSSKKSERQWCGPRDMVDMLELVKRYAYYPATRGSNSIKNVLPAVLNDSIFLQEKYGKPIYGAAGGIPSSNFSDWQWIRMVNGQVQDPYKLLPPMFIDIPENIDELLSDSDSLANGGAALTAYARIQFTEMSEYEREQLRGALLKYCELDTLAMVMIFEAWRDKLN